eukprot:gene2739-3164_t
MKVLESLLSVAENSDFDEITSLASETTDEEYTSVLEDSYQTSESTNTQTSFQKNAVATQCCLPNPYTCDNSTQCEPEDVQLKDTHLEDCDSAHHQPNSGSGTAEEEWLPDSDSEISDEVQDAGDKNPSTPMECKYLVLKSCC